MHSLLQAYGCAGVTIDGVTVTGGKNGVSLGTSTDAVVKNSTFECTGYGVRAYGTGAYGMKVENCTIEAELPIVVRNATGAYTVNISGNNNAITAGNENGYDVIFTNGDDGTYVEPTGKTLNVYSTVNVDGTLTVDGTIYLKDKDATITVDDENLNVLSGVDGMDKDYRNVVYYLVEGFVAQIVRGGEVFAKYPTVSGALAEAGSGDTVQVLADVTENTVLVVMGGVTLDLNGHKLGAITILAGIFACRYRALQ